MYWVVWDGVTSASQAILLGHKDPKPILDSVAECRKIGAEYWFDDGRVGPKDLAALPGMKIISDARMSREYGL